MFWHAHNLKRPRSLEIDPENGPGIAISVTNIA